MGNYFLYLFLSCASLIAVGCQSPPVLRIKSNTPARIELNGVQVCASTPCKIVGNHLRDGYNMECVRGANSPLEAFPLNSDDGYRQRKVVYGACDQTVNVFFDMNSGDMVNVVQKNTDSKSLDEKLSILQNLKNKNLITDEEYKQKKAEILSSYK